MAPTAFAFTKLVVSDLDRAITFYRDAIGLKLLTRVTAPNGEYAQEEAIFAGEGNERGPMLLLVRYLNLPAPATGAAWTGFAVSDLSAMVAAVEQGGGRVVIPIHDVPEHKVTVAIVADPEGHLIELTTALG